MRAFLMTRGEAVANPLLVLKRVRLSICIERVERKKKKKKKREKERGW